MRFGHRCKVDTAKATMLRLFFFLIRAGSYNPSDAQEFCTQRARDRSETGAILWALLDYLINIRLSYVALIQNI